MGFSLEETLSSVKFPFPNLQNILQTLLYYIFLPVGKLLSAKL
jgi:hypothetical protein